LEFNLLKMAMRVVEIGAADCQVLMTFEKHLGERHKWVDGGYMNCGMQEEEPN
jgi:hypothetical protein